MYKFTIYIVNEMFTVVKPYFIPAFALPCYSVIIQKDDNALGKCRKFMSFVVLEQQRANFDSGT